MLIVLITMTGMEIYINGDFFDMQTTFIMRRNVK